jgi:hypothetical protein
MAKDEDPAAKNGAAEYEVGYGKPPKSTQFKPGQSGNPKGRSRGSKNLKTDLAEELSEKIVVHEGGSSHSISKQRAVVKTLITNTLKGDARAATSLLSMMMKLLDTGAGEASDEGEALHSDELEILETYKKRLTAPDEEKEGDAEPTGAA